MKDFDLIDECETEEQELTACDIRNIVFVLLWCFTGIAIILSSYNVYDFAGVAAVVLWFVTTMFLIIKKNRNEESNHNG